jgi:hypothetical protein
VTCITILFLGLVCVTVPWHAEIASEKGDPEFGRMMRILIELNEAQWENKWHVVINMPYFTLVRVVGGGLSRLMTVRVPTFATANPK